MVATKADILFAVSTDSQFMLKAGQPHWMAMKRIMRYLKGTLDFKLFFEGRILPWEDFVMQIGQV